MFLLLTLVMCYADDRKDVSAAEWVNILMAEKMFLLMTLVMCYADDRKYVSAADVGNGLIY